VEETFVNKDPASTLKLGQARGMALLAPARLGIPIGEYAANQVKKTVVGVGHADKKQVQAMVKVLLPRADFSSADEADALAIAICHAHQSPAVRIAGGRAMIGKLKGRVDAVLEDSLILDVQGVGYEVFGSSKLLGLYRGGEEGVELWIDTLVREDLIRLNGFSSQQERQWFRLLQSVQGVGAKVALAILGTLSTGDLASAIALQDKAMVARAPGVGPKVAQRIVAELKDKAPTLSGDSSGTIGLQQELGEGVAAFGGRRCGLGADQSWLLRAAGFRRRGTGG
jgi:Holliday junction DNA helicase RuvA